MEGLWGFVLLAVLLSLTPGPDDVLVVGSAVRGGPRLGAASAAGIAVGSLAWGAASGIGLAGVLSRAPAVYDGIRLVGAGYLVVLGLLPLLVPLVRRTRRVVPAAPVAGATGPARLRSAFAAGMVSDLLNPKIGMFYLAGVPQFVPAGQPVLGWSLLLAGIDVAVAMLWFTGLICVASAAMARLRRPAVAVWSQRVAGASLIGVGLTAALSG
jgi:threonine/homoserine/homoserine lactone efflux protein